MCTQGEGGWGGGGAGAAAPVSEHYYTGQGTLRYFTVHTRS